MKINQIINNALIETYNNHNKTLIFKKMINKLFNKDIVKIFKIINSQLLRKLKKIIFNKNLKSQKNKKKLKI